MFIVRINVEKKDNEIYFAGPFRSKADAQYYCDLYHGDLDGTEVIKVHPGLQF